jgi:predicted DNA-binding protein (UPF0251 family)
MPRPKRCRRVCFDPSYRVFKPQGVPMTRLSSIEMGTDELEALRLSDVEDLSQAEAAKSMEVSQPTFNRILSGARAKVARALTQGVALKIASGPSAAPEKGVHK